MTRFAPHTPLTAAQQLYHLRRNPIAIGEGDAYRGRLDWRMRVQPTPMSRDYEIAIALPPEERPVVIVLAPDLVNLAGGRKLPHVYREDPAELCLYRPLYREWESWMRLDMTIVPWAYLWFYYFEDWLLTDEWAGGGEHPTPSAGPTARLPSRALRQLRSDGQGRPSRSRAESWPVAR